MNETQTKTVFFVLIFFRLADTGDEDNGMDNEGEKEEEKEGNP